MTDAPRDTHTLFERKNNDVFRILLCTFVCRSSHKSSQAFQHTDFGTLVSAASVGYRKLQVVTYELCVFALHVGVTFSVLTVFTLLALWTLPTLWTR